MMLKQHLMILIKLYDSFPDDFKDDIFFHDLVETSNKRRFAAELNTLPDDQLDRFFSVLLQRGRSRPAILYDYRDYHEMLVRTNNLESLITFIQSAYHKIKTIYSREYTYSSNKHQKSCFGSLEGLYSAKDLNLIILLNELLCTAVKSFL